MNDGESDLRRQISELTDRLARVEQRLGLPPVIRAVPVPPVPPSVPVTPAAPPTRRELPQPPGLQGLISRAQEARTGFTPAADSSSYRQEVPAEPTAPPTAPPTTTSRQSPTLAASAGFTPAAAPPSRQRAAKEAATTGIAAMEKLIGGRWYAVIGAVIVVIGVGLFFRLAVQEGWLVLTPAARCIGGAVFGALLLVGGEIGRRRINDNAGAGLSAAGIGVAFASVYAAYQMYHLLGQVPAFLILASVAALGIFVGARARQVSVAVVSLLCGYLTPILLAEAQPRPFVMPAYLFTLLVVGLTLSAWRGGRFVVLRSLVWWATMVLGSVWALRYGDAEPLAALAFLALSWSAIHAELAISSGRFGLVPGAGGNIADDDSDDLRTGETARRTAGAWRPLSSSFSTTTWAALVGTLLLRHWAQTPDWLATAGLAVVSGMLAMTLAGHLRVLRDRPLTDSQRLGACLIVQAGALVIAAAALGVQGPAQVVFWLAMAVAVIVGGRWIGSRGLDVYGLIVLSLATGRTLLWESWNGTMPRTGVEFSGLYLSWWAALTASVGVGWLVVATLLRRSSASSAKWMSVSHVAVAIGMSLFCAALQHVRASAIAPLVTVATLGLALTVVGRFLGSGGLKGYAVLVLAGACAYSVVNRYWLSGVSGPGLDFLGLRFTAWTGALAYLSGAWLLAAWLSARSRGVVWRGLSVFAAGAGVIVAMGAIAHESAIGSSLIMAWFLIALAAGAGGFFAPDLNLDRWGLGALTATVVAWAVNYQFWGEGWRASMAAPGLHPGLWTGLAIAGGFALFARRVLAPAAVGDRVRPILVGFSFIAMTALIFAATSLEVGRSGAILANDRTVQRAAVSVWWGIFAFGLIALGFALQGRSRNDPQLPRGIPICRQIGLALLGIAALKALVFDLGEVNQLGRVISIVGVGLLMLAVSVAYAKVSSRLAALRPQGPAEVPQ